MSIAIQCEIIIRGISFTIEVSDIALRIRVWGGGGQSYIYVHCDMVNVNFSSSRHS